jgi:hypothetical protein
MVTGEPDLIEILYRTYRSNLQPLEKFSVICYPTQLVPVPVLHGMHLAKIELYLHRYQAKHHRRLSEARYGISFLSLVCCQSLPRNSFYLAFFNVNNEFGIYPVLSLTKQILERKKLPTCL